MPETPVVSKARSGMRGVVFLGDRFIELDDPATVTLEDLCESFGTPWESGMHVRQRSTGRVVATLPFEPLPPINEVADVVLKPEDAFGVAAADTCMGIDNVPKDGLSNEESGVMGGKNNETNDFVNDTEEDEDGDAYAVVYDLVNSNAPEIDETSAALANPLAANIRDIPGIKETMRQLVELGVAELLTAEPVSIVNAKCEYNPVEAPGLLRRIVYPASQYSPYRAERDPVRDGRHALFRSPAAGPSSSTTSIAAAPCKGTTPFIGEGGPYTSYLDSYALGERLEMPRVLPSTSVRKASLIAPLTNEEQQKIFGV